VTPRGLDVQGLADRQRAPSTAGVRRRVRAFGGVRRLRRPLYGVARRVIGGDGAAEDVTQEVFEHLWTRPYAFEPGWGSLRAWLSVLAHRRAVEYLRRTGPGPGQAAEDDIGRPLGRAVPPPLPRYLRQLVLAVRVLGAALGQSARPVLLSVYGAGDGQWVLGANAEPVAAELVPDAVDFRMLVGGRSTSEEVPRAASAATRPRCGTC
jgi:RNA polymerase sigma factor (sigma-70 family)